MIKFIFTFIFFTYTSLFYGCSPAGVLAGGGATTLMVAEGERTLGEVVDDATIRVNLAANFLKTDSRIFINVNINVIDGRVLLTGLVDTQEIRIEAIKKTWEVTGVEEVINEIEIGDKATLKEYANDLWINTQVKGFATKAVGLRILSYNFETIRGKVYIAGLTTREDQLEAVIESAKKVKGVTEIVNYVILKK